MSEDFEEDFEEEGEGIDYFSIMKQASGVDLIEAMDRLMKNDKDGEKLQNWMMKHQMSLKEQYMRAIENENELALKISLHDFGINVYVIMNSNDVYLSGEKERTKVEQKPQSTKLQKELEERFTDENIASAIDELTGGEYTDDDN